MSLEDRIVRRLDHHLGSEEAPTSVPFTSDPAPRRRRLVRAVTGAPAGTTVVVNRDPAKVEAVEAKAVARAATAAALEARRLAEAEAERLRKENEDAARKLAAALADLAKKPVVIAPAPPAPKPVVKKGAFNVLDHLRKNGGKPVESVASRPSKEALAALGRTINNDEPSAPKLPDPVYNDDPKRTLRERIRALNPNTVARIHAEKPVVHTWPTIKRLIAAEGKAEAGTTFHQHIKVFVAWCEQR